MPVFMILIILSLSFYVYFKIKFFRVKAPMHRKWLSAKSSVALGLFVTFFAINSFIAQPSTLSTIIGIIFVLIGVGSAWAGYRAYKYYLPLVVEEANKK
ncbi:YtpI family protein [Bacillus salitolerans]|uniref:YtpI family protein n=1 Tax=Bacillus salitolerans TaxID=1437434 RepID=A0ABW4LQI9_9BACI